MYRTNFDPCCGAWQFFRAFMDSAPWGGRRYYTRKEHIEQLEKLKGRLEKEIAGIEELIRDLKEKDAKHSSA